MMDYCIQAKGLGLAIYLTKDEIDFLKLTLPKTLSKPVMIAGESRN